MYHEQYIGYAKPPNQVLLKYDLYIYNLHTLDNIYMYLH